MWQYLVSGTILGFSAGVAPGPLLALVITETLRHNQKQGIRVALVPLLTDCPIILFSLVLVDRLAQFKPFLGWLSVAGALFVFYLAWESFNAGGIELTAPVSKPKSVRKGMIANFLNPHPYLFWITVGSPIILRASRVNLLSALLFVGSFYLLLVGSKMLLALMIGKYHSFLAGRLYTYLMRFLGVVLAVFGLLFLWDGLHLAGLL